MRLYVNIGLLLVTSAFTDSRESYNDDVRLQGQLPQSINVLTLAEGTNREIVLANTAMAV